MIERIAGACMPPCPPAQWFHRGATALLLVDLQQGTCGDAQPRPSPDFDTRFAAATLPAARRVLAAARHGGLEVIHTMIANLTADGRDRSFDYKRCGMGFPPGSRAAEVIPALAPLADELVLPKSSSSPFSSTVLDYLLRNLGIRTLVVIGLLTDQCIDHTVKDAADRGYRVVCVHDACQAITPERHAAALECFAGYGEQIDSAAFVAAIDGAATPSQDPAMPDAGFEPATSCS
jgi:nicotinamidase-related amidase